MKIRRYAPGEEEAIWDVFFQTTRISNARDYHPDLIERWAPPDRDRVEWRERLDSSNPFVALIDKKIVGMAELIDEGHIDYFYVLPDHQGKGVGSALLKTIEAEAEKHGFTALSADVSVTAEPFFSSRGFEIIEARSKVILGHPAPNFAMRKELKRV